MPTNEILTALEYVIYRESCSKFTANNIDPIQARLIMKAVYCRFLEDCTEDNVLKRLRVNDRHEQSEKQVKTGTIAELMEDFYNSGFKPDEEEPNGGTEDCSTQEG